MLRDTRCFHMYILHCWIFELLWNFPRVLHEPYSILKLHLDNCMARGDINPLSIRHIGYIRRNARYIWAEGKTSSNQMIYKLMRDPIYSLWSIVDHWAWSFPS